MKRLCMGAFLVFGCVGGVNAQAPAAPSADSSAIESAAISGLPANIFESSNAAATGSYTGANSTRHVRAPAETFPSFSSGVPGPLLLTSRDNVPVAIPAEPAPAPAPRYIFGDRDDYRWQLGIGFAWERFRSSVFNASAIGLNTSVSYFTNDWFAVEGSVSSTFAPALSIGPVKLLNYGVGPKIAWRQRRWEPFLHAIVGGTHVLPQTAAGGQNAFMVSPGGGADWRWMARLSVRLEADYVRTSLFSQHQNNFQLVGGLVFHF